MMSEAANDLRPRDFALLLLATGENLPRRRARDQQADRAGLSLKRRVLEELIAQDPDVGELQPALLAIIERFGQPFGPTRSMALTIFEEWTRAQATPDWLLQLLDANVHQDRGGARAGRQLPG